MKVTFNKKFTEFEFTSFEMLLSNEFESKEEVQNIHFRRKSSGVQRYQS